MKLLVLGATGGVGHELVRQAIARGHEVSALVRSPEALLEFRERVTIRRGDLLNPGDLVRAISGQDAVLSAFGPRLPLAKADRDLLERFAQALTRTLREADVLRLLIVSTAFLFEDAILPPANLVGRLFFPSVVRDAARMEYLIAESGLQWTIVRPPRLTDKPASHKYRVREGHLPRFGFHISRADVAHFLLDATEQNAPVRKVVGVCN